MEFRELLAAANAVYRENGYHSKSSTEFHRKTPNVKLLAQVRAGLLDVEITQEDHDKVDNICQYFKGLGFKALGRDLSEYEVKLLELVRDEKFPSDNDLGLIASMPNVYEVNFVQAAWNDKEQELSRTSKHIGEVGFSVEINLSVQFVKKLQENKQLFCCTDPLGNIVKFYARTSVVEKYGKNFTVSGYVKKHIQNMCGGDTTVINTTGFKSLESWTPRE